MYHFCTNFKIDFLLPIINYINTLLIPTGALLPARLVCFLQPCVWDPVRAERFYLAPWDCTGGAGNPVEGGNGRGELARILLHCFEAILVCQELLLGSNWACVLPSPFPSISCSYIKPTHRPPPTTPILPLVILLRLTKKLARNASNSAMLASAYPSTKSPRIALQTVKI